MAKKSTYKSLFKAEKALMGDDNLAQIHNGEQWVNVIPKVDYDGEVDDYVLQLQLDCGTTVKLARVDMEQFIEMFQAFEDNMD